MFFRKWYYTYFSKEKNFYSKLEKLLGFTPTYFKLYKLAFSHKSKSRKNNERLEFLGDSILDAVISNILYLKFQEKLEGDLSKFRSKLVSRKHLNFVANELNLMDLLDFNKKISSINEKQTNMPGNTLEALIGAIYLDKGYEKTYQFIEKKIVKPYTSWHELQTEVVDFKSLLYTHGQKTDRIVEFKTMNDNNSSQNDRFEVAVFLDDLEFARASGKNKKTAHQLASKKALQKINNS